MQIAKKSSRHDAEKSVFDRYAAAAQSVEPALCCPVDYAPELLDVIPREIIDRDYGCGDPTSYVQPGETVLDLGSGGGKVCYILAQVVGQQGRVIGVDCNPTMLELARRHRQTVAARLGYSNVEFRCGLIQDLRLDLDRLTQEISRRHIATPDDWLAARAIEQHLRQDAPLIPDESIDCVVSNCVLNLVCMADREQLFAEIFRVLRRGGRAAISDIVADEDVPDDLRDDPELWSGCISGAFREDRLLQAFEAAGFHGMQVVQRQTSPWRVVRGIEFRSVTVMAHKGKQGPCLERNQAVIYRGPFKKVEDDDGHTFYRGERMAVCDKTFQLLRREPYEGVFDSIEPRVEVPLDVAQPFHCKSAARRHPRATKGDDYDITVSGPDACCGPSGSCC